MTVKCLPTQELAKELTIEEMSALYDRIYNIADRLLKKYNPCKIHRGKGKSKDYMFCKNYKDSSKRLCCNGCGKWLHKSKGYWSKTGCTTKCLACKLHLCYSITDRILHLKFRKLHDYAHKHLSFTYYDKYWKENTTFAMTHRYYVSKEQWLSKLKESRSERTN